LLFAFALWFSRAQGVKGRAMRYKAKPSAFFICYLFLSSLRFVLFLFPRIFRVAFDTPLSVTLSSSLSTGDAARGYGCALMSSFTCTLFRAFLALGFELS
jgi:hypothetical protein